MNKKLVALTLCAFLTISLWACDSDDELEKINSEENKATISEYKKNSNFHANRAASRAQNNIIPGKFSSFEVEKIEANKKSHEKRRANASLATLSDNTQPMDTRKQQNSGRRKYENQENNGPKLEKTSKQNNTAVRPKSRSNSSLSDRERRSASRLGNYSTHRNYDDNSDNE